MANYYIDFVGLNTYIYEPAGGEVAEINEELTNGDTVYARSGYIGIYESGGNSDIEKVLEKYKNNAFSTATSLSIATPTLFTALMLRRNGPHGWPAFKAARIGQNPLTRNQKKNNVLSVLSDPVPITRVIDGKQSTIMPKRGTVALYDEPSVVARHHPLLHAFGFVLDEEPSYGTRTSRMKRLRIKHSFDNRTYNFTNKEINKTLRIPDSDLEKLSDESAMAPLSLEDYIGLSGMYLDGALDDPENPIDEFLRMRYKSTIYPPERFTFKKENRQRTTFSFPWRDSLSNRQQESKTDGFTSFNLTFDEGTAGDTARLSSSIWPLDVDPNWLTDQLVDDSMIHRMGVSHSGSGYTPTPVGTSCTNYTTTSSYGILWNHYAQASKDLHVETEVRVTRTGKRVNNINERLRPAPYYSRRHLYGYKESVTSPTGLLGIRAGENMNSNAAKHLLSGEAYWDAPSQTNSSPFYDSYDEYAKDIRLVGKNYSIIPEFRISDFVEHYQSKSVDVPLNNFLSINGAPSEYSDSSTKKFYDVYATTDLMNSFSFLLEDHEDFAKPTRLTITCNAISKFLPYDGFYPVQRTVKMAEQFYDSYKDYFAFGSASAGLSSFFGRSGNTITNFLSASAQALIEPLFAPGTLYNSIKSGVACDWPTVIHTGSSTLSILDGYTRGLGKSSFDRRIPFEALVEPQKYLANIPLSTVEMINSSSWSSTSSWDGNGDNLYAKMAHNFLGEIPNFFLDGGSYSAIASKKNKEILFVREQTTYAMRVDMYRTMNSRRSMVSNSVGTLYYPPQDIGNGTLKENITMYSRPSAFGIECEGQFKWNYVGGSGNSNVIESIPEADGYGISVADNGSDIGTIRIESKEGLNYPYTPPYYHGHAWADIVYKSGTRQGRVPLDEIIASSSVSYWRFDSLPYRKSLSPFTSDTVYNTTSSIGPQAIDVLNDNAMQISASVNLLGFAQVGEFNENIVENQENSRWVIQAKFETPILNFKKYEQSSSITVPNNPTSASVPRGMWHQFGELPAKSEGVYLKVSDVPRSWNKAHSRPIKQHPTSSLADLVGFSTQPLRLGQMPESMVVKEAIVLLPYKETSEGKQFFKIEETPQMSKVTVKTALKMASDPTFGINDGQGTVQKTVGLDMPDRTIIDMVTKMQEFIIPPQMDFVNYPDAIDPFLMYILDFEYTFTREDLQYIWQGLKPPSANNHNMLKRTLSHKLIDNGLLSQNDIIDAKNLKWIVFKVKQRANTNYFDKIYLQAGQSNFGRQQPQGKLAAIPESTLIERNPNKGISYNWPYDFFSFIELVKVDASVDFKGVDDEGKETIVKRNKAMIERGNEFIKPSKRLFSGE